MKHRPKAPLCRGSQRHAGAFSPLYFSAFSGYNDSRTLIFQQKGRDPMTEKMKNALPGGLAFPLLGVYLEWLLFFADGAGNPSALVLFRLALAGAAFGAFLWLLS